MKINVLGPDVNESYEKFGVNQHGEIRFGLAAIKGLGDSAAMAIITEREKNGPYKSIFNFAERVNLNSVNRKAFESLALSGGFDSFGIRREDFFAQNNKGETFIETVLRYGQIYQQEKNEMQNSLFGGFDDVEIQTPPLLKSDERWSDIERLNKERELVGIYLSAHPLDEYKIVLDNLCNTHCSELADRCAALVDREEITLGGIVTGIQSRIGKNDKPWGIITLEDFEGSGELVLFGDDWLNLNGKFIEGVSVYVTGKMQSRFYNSDQKELKVTNVQLLQDVKEEAIDRITISLTTDLLNDQIVTELGELIQQNPGATKLFFQLHDATGKNHVLLRSTGTMVDVKRSLLQYIEQNEALDYRIN
jgi:DNA polymerase-3 subunit alpha